MFVNLFWKTKSGFGPPGPNQVFFFVPPGPLQSVTWAWPEVEEKCATHQKRLCDSGPESESIKCYGLWLRLQSKLPTQSTRSAIPFWFVGLNYFTCQSINLKCWKVTVGFWAVVWFWAGVKFYLRQETRNKISSTWTLILAKTTGIHRLTPTPTP